MQHLSPNKKAPSLKWAAIFNVATCGIVGLNLHHEGVIVHILFWLMALNTAGILLLYGAELWHNSLIDAEDDTNHWRGPYA